MRKIFLNIPNSLNNNLYRPVLYFIILLSTTVSWTQQSNDTISRSVQDLSRPNYPRIRQLSVSYDQSGWTDYTTDFKGFTIEKGKVNRGRLQVNGTIPIITKENFTLSATEVYTHEELSLKDIINPTFGQLKSNYSFENFNTTLNLTYKSRLLSKVIITNINIIVGSQDFINVEKVSGLLTATLIFQKRPNTRYTLGLAAIVDPSSQIPAFPIITYWHRFKDPRWEMDVILPSTVKIRRSGTMGGWLSVGSDFSSQSFFLKNIPDRSGTYENLYSELTFNLSYERIIMKNFLLGLQAGHKSTLQNRIVKVNEESRNKAADINFNSNLYFKAGISFIISNEKFKKDLDRLKERSSK